MITDFSRSIPVAITSNFCVHISVSVHLCFHGNRRWATLKTVYHISRLFRYIIFPGYTVGGWLGHCLADQRRLGADQLLEVSNKSASKFIHNPEGTEADWFRRKTHCFFKKKKYNSIFSFNPDPTIRHSFWSLLIGSMINWTGPYGASQQSTQRFGSLPTLRQAKMYAQLYFCFTLMRNV